MAMAIFAVFLAVVCGTSLASSSTAAVSPAISSSSANGVLATPTVELSRVPSASLATVLISSSPLSSVSAGAVSVAATPSPDGAAASSLVTSPSISTDAKFPSPAHSTTSTTSPKSTAVLQGSDLPTSPSGTDTAAPGKVGMLDAIGITIGYIITVLFVSYGIYYVTCRERWFPRYLNQIMKTDTGTMAQEQPAVPEVGIAHRGFVDDNGKQCKVQVETKGEQAADVPSGHSEENPAVTFDSAL